MRHIPIAEFKDKVSEIVSAAEAGEEIVITQRGKAIARLVPEHADGEQPVDWSQSPAVKRDRSAARVLTAEESLEIVHEAGGKW